MAVDGRELRIAIGPGRAGFDSEQGGANGDFHRLTHSRLFSYPPFQDSDGEWYGNVPHLIGKLAEGHEDSSDGMTVWVTLRKGVYSSFGNELTANDVKYSWDRSFALRDVGKWVAIIGSVVSEDDVIPIDRYTVEFRLRAPNPTFLQELTRSTPPITDSTEAKKHATEADPLAKAWLQRNPAGFGAYILESHTPWKETVFRANPGAAGGKPPIETIRYLVVPGIQERIRMLRDGEVHLVRQLGPANVFDLEGLGGVRLSHAKSGAHVALEMNCQVAPFTNKTVRQAVAFAVPYQEILSEVYRNTAQPWISALPTTTPMADTSFGVYEHNPDKARKLLEQAGFADGFDTQLFVDAADEEHVGAAELIVPALAEAGIRATLELMDSGIFWEGARYYRPYPMLIYQDHHQVPDPYYGLVHDYGKGRMGLINCGQYANDEVFALIAKVENASDEAQRRELVREAQRIIMDDAPNAFLAQPSFIAGISENLRGYFWAPDGSLVAEDLSFRD
jgi:peptide/nickel transport system substrate-binding protein